MMKDMYVWRCQYYRPSLDGQPAYEMYVECDNIRRAIELCEGNSKIIQVTSVHRLAVIRERDLPEVMRQ